ncbi:MAG: hypothetical protein EAZ57_07085 [Cytophagales bacterium]|nr:MAG: hypothetical protein EAZ67_07895 [Cytophagales bacterium]TAF60465.1 MAG: hypothetical protein EAZ57_07085 [Cytophagales bacterium]
MQGQTHIIVEQMIEKYSKGNSLTSKLIETKLSLRGINRHAFTPNSIDDPALLARLQTIEKELDHLFA